MLKSPPLETTKQNHTKNTQTQIQINPIKSNIKR